MLLTFCVGGDAEDALQQHQPAFVGRMQKQATYSKVGLKPALKVHATDAGQSCYLHSR